MFFSYLSRRNHFLSFGLCSIPSNENIAFSARYREFSDFRFHSYIFGFYTYGSAIGIKCNFYFFLDGCRLCNLNRFGKSRFRMSFKIHTDICFSFSDCCNDSILYCTYRWIRRFYDRTGTFKRQIIPENIYFPCLAFLQ